MNFSSRSACQNAITCKVEGKCRDAAREPGGVACTVASIGIDNECSGFEDTISGAFPEDNDWSHLALRLDVGQPCGGEHISIGCEDGVAEAAVKASREFQWCCCDLVGSGRPAGEESASDEDGEFPIAAPAGAGGETIEVEVAGPGGEFQCSGYREVHSISGNTTSSVARLQFGFTCLIDTDVSQVIWCGAEAGNFKRRGVVISGDSLQGDSAIWGIVSGVEQTQSVAGGEYQFAVGGPRGCESGAVVGAEFSKMSGVGEIPEVGLTFTESCDKAAIRSGGTESGPD
jgi:hypothetical protein